MNVWIMFVDWGEGGTTAREVDISTAIPSNLYEGLQQGTPTRAWVETLEARKMVLLSGRLSFEADSIFTALVKVLSFYPTKLTIEHFLHVQSLPISLSRHLVSSRTEIYNSCFLLMFKSIISRAIQHGSTRRSTREQKTEKPENVLCFVQG